MELVSLNLRSKVEDIYRIFRGKRVLVAFSGGVDSSLMVSLARDVAESVLAVTMNSQIIPLEEVERAKQVAGELCVNHMVVWIDMLRSPQFVANTPDRCYYCKKELSRYLKRVAYEQGYELIVEGTNASDILGYRPGFLALREEGILSPYLMVGITKEEIRLIAHEKGLSVYNQPSMACLSSRIPYGEIITEEKLSRIADAERFIKKLIGVEVIRVRSHGDIARIEVGKDERIKLFSTEVLDKISKKIKELGFKYCTLDMEGYRTGSMDDVLKEKTIKISE